MTSTPRLVLPLIAAGQAQKELMHNEALQLLDLAVAPAVEEPPRSAPPATPLIGSCYIVGPNAAGIWGGHEGKLAGYSAGGWRFVVPPDGMNVPIRSTGTSAVFRDGQWIIGTVTAERVVVGGNQVVGARAAAIASPSGGVTVDVEGRTVISAILAALRQHGLIAT